MYTNVDISIKNAIAQKFHVSSPTPLQTKRERESVFQFEARKNGKFLLNYSICYVDIPYEGT